MDTLTRPKSRAFERLTRLIEDRRGDLSPPDPPPNPGTLVLTCLWFGLVTGLLELGLALGLRSLDDAPALSTENRHVLWIVPLVNLVIFAGCGGLLAVAARVSPRRAAGPAGFLPVFVSIVTLLLTVRGLHMASCLILATALALRGGRWLRRRSAVVDRAVRWSLPVLVVAVGLLVGSAFDREVLREHRLLKALPPAPTSAPNVLFIVLDTVRADHLGAYGYRRDTTPNLDRLAREGVRFERAYSTAPWTLPSHASMFTGRWPHELTAGHDSPLDAREPTLAERLRDRGYLTGGFVSNTYYCSAETGLGRGFAHYEDHVLTPLGVLRASALGRRVVARLASIDLAVASGSKPFHGRPASGKGFKSAEEINGSFLAWLDRQEGGRPFFAFLNYFDAHHPYVLPDGYDRHFGVRPESAADDLLLQRWWSVDKRNLPPRSVALAHDAYDDCLGYLDAQLGRLFEELTRRGTLERTVVVVTADHGEHLGEHSLFGHACSLYLPEVHVPLIVIGTGRVPRGRSVSECVSTRDLPATIADLAGAGAPFPGRSLARFWSASDSLAPGECEAVLSEVDEPAKGPANGGCSPVFRGAMKSLVRGELVYIRNGDGREELYDLAADPHETADLAGAPGSGPALERFRGELERLLLRDDPPRGAGSRPLPPASTGRGPG